VKSQAVFRQPLWQHFKDSPRITFILEDDDQVISETNQRSAAGQSRHDLPCKPLIKHFVQKKGMVLSNR
jgi:hypothetical protein